jgi:hypothetical protein
MHPISHRYQPDHTTSGALIAELIQTVVDQLLLHNTRHPIFEQITFLKSSDFKFEEGAGLIVFKFKEHPFVVKLFIETPELFAHPAKKGLVQKAMFAMSGGGGRHISGLARIKNRVVVKEMVEQHPYWKRRIDLPRKWFFLPKGNRWLEIKAVNFKSPQESCVIPSIYAIVCDEVKGSKLSFFSEHDRTTILSLVRDMDSRLDPFLANYVREDDGTIVIIDTEHFPSSLGLHHKQYVGSYTGWYASLAAKYLHTCYAPKSYRRKMLYVPLPKA